MMSYIPPGNLPLRVNQLDASSSDDYIYEIILEKLKDVFKYLKLSALFSTFQQEVEAIIRFTLWLVIFRRHGATLGQQMLQLRYTPVSRGETGLGKISRLQSALYLVCNVLFPYLSSKLSGRQQHRDFALEYPILNKLQVVLNGIWCCLNLGNFVTFLLNGTFLHLYERICGIRAIHPDGRQFREVGFEFSNREIVWHGFAEFMIFIMPYVNMKKLKSVFTSRSDRSMADQGKFCAICGSHPTNPQQMSGCLHIYCYHCIAVESDEGCMMNRRDETKAEKFTAQLAQIG